MFTFRKDVTENEIIGYLLNEDAKPYKYTKLEIGDLDLPEHEFEKASNYDKTKKFNGKLYRFWAHYRNKNQANQIKRDLKEAHYLVRKYEVNGGYSIYVNSSKRSKPSKLF